MAIDQVNEGTYVDTPAIGFLFKQLAAQFDLSAYWLQKAWIDWAVATGIEFLVSPLSLSNIHISI